MARVALRPDAYMRPTTPNNEEMNSGRRVLRADDRGRGGKPKAEFRQITQADLPDHDVLVEVSHSTLNYKDGLALTGKA